MAKCACARSLSLLLTKHPEGFGVRCSIGFQWLVPGCDK